jgi:hypothetical protein
MGKGLSDPFITKKRMWKSKTGTFAGFGFPIRIGLIDKYFFNIWFRNYDNFLDLPESLSKG